jgi:NADPH-dependent 2,4-dienoyl-CoA reductase/sulfur reductase-like enzyme/rhodanese-related sulfurtransferase
MSKYLIVGGVAGGMSTAARLRRNSEHDEIIVFERGEYVSFANCGLPYYIGGEIGKRNSLFVQTPDAFRARFNVDVRVRNEVLSINRKNRSLKIKDLSTGEKYTETYDKLVLSPGAMPVKLNVPGIDHPAIFTLRNIPDADRIKRHIEGNKVKTAVIIGAGYIGLEMAENLSKLGIAVSLVEALPQVLSNFDPDMAAAIQEELKRNKVEVLTGESAAEFSDKNGRLAVRLVSGKELQADMAIVSIGVLPDTGLAVEAGLELGVKNSIAVNEYMQTSDPDIYAVGDAIQVTHRVTGSKMVIPLAGPANKEGRIAADNIVFGNKKKYAGSFGAGIARIFGLTAAATGANEAMLKSAGSRYKSVVIHPPNHAGYYPGAERIALKLLFSVPDGKVLGAQCVGPGGVDKRIDVISAYMSMNGTVYDLAEFEHAYAPPYSSAKDPVNMAGFTAENIITGKVDAITWQELLESDPKEFFILDVRSPGEVKRGRAEGSVNIYVDDLRKKLALVPRDKKIAVYCASGVRSGIAARILKQNGYGTVCNISGGFLSFPKSQAI